MNLQTTVTVVRWVGYSMIGVGALALALVIASRVREGKWRRQQ